MVGNYVDFCGILWSFCGNLLVGLEYWGIFVAMVASVVFL